MDNVIAIGRKDDLRDLADQINKSLEHSLVEVAILLARARTQFVITDRSRNKSGRFINEDGWGSWVNDSIHLSLSRAKQLAKIGESGDPIIAAQALDDLREKNRLANKKARLPKPQENLPPVTGDEPDGDYDYDDDQPEDPAAELLNRAKMIEQIALAYARELSSNMEVDSTLVKAVKRAAGAWSNLAAKLEDKLP